MSGGRSLGLGVVQGATANFGDEIRGVQAAAGLPDWVPGGVDAIVGLARLGFEYLNGGDEAAGRYRDGRDQFRQMMKASEEQNPVITGAGQVAGAMALPVGVTANAVTLPARMVAGAVTGGVQGSLAGAGAGETAQDRASGALVGGGAGVALGGAAAPVVQGVVRGAQTLARPITTGIRGAFNPEAEAARRVVGAIQRDANADPGAVQRLTPQEFGANVAGGGPATIMDMGGETTRALARSAANTSPEGRGLINRTIDDRFEGQAGRLAAWFNQTFHYPNAHAQQQAIEATAAAVNRPAYLRAYRSQNAQALWDNDLANLAQAPDVQSAIRMVTSTAANRTAANGGPPVRNPFVVDPTTGRMVLNTQNGTTAIPNLQFWDLVKRNLDAIGTAESRALSRSLRTHLDGIVPEYAVARQGAAHFFGAENALEAGQNFVTQNHAIPQVRAVLGRMTPQERQLFQDGFISRYVETLNATGDRRNILNQIAATPAAREKLELVIGRQRSAELEIGLRVEGIMDLARGAVQGNSSTARQLAELGFAGGAGSVGAYGAYNLDPAQVTYAAVAGALLAGKKGIDARVANRVAQMLVSNDPAILNRGLRIAANNQRLLEALRSVDRRLAQVSGQESAGITVPAVQAGAVGRAEEQQPAVPGPPSQ
jgi:hypothetical protein